MLKEYHGKLTHHMQDAYWGVSGLGIAFQGGKPTVLPEIRRNMQFLMIHLVLSDDQA